MDLEFFACLLASFSMLRPGTGRGPEERWGPQCAPHPVIGSEYLRNPFGFNVQDSWALGFKV